MWGQLLKGNAHDFASALTGFLVPCLAHDVNAHIMLSYCNNRFGAFGGSLLKPVVFRRVALLKTRLKCQPQCWNGMSAVTTQSAKKLEMIGIVDSGTISMAQFPVFLQRSQHIKRCKLSFGEQLNCWHGKFNAIQIKMKVPSGDS